jgi:hypothetical protein
MKVTWRTMSERESSLLILFGGLLAILALWALSILAVRWDTRRRRLSELERRAWVALAVLAPLFGFAIYIFMRLVRGYLAFPQSDDRTGDEYQTSVKPRENGRTYTAIDSSGARSSPGVPEPAWGQAPPEGANGKQAHPGDLANAYPQTMPAPFQQTRASYALVALEGPHLGQQFILNRFPARIGRGPEADVPLDADLNISRRHAEIYRQAGELHLRDLNSTHGTLINDQPAQDHALAPGDRIRLGGTVLILREIQ